MERAHDCDTSPQCARRVHASLHRPNILYYVSSRLCVGVLLSGVRRRAKEEAGL